MRGVGLKETCQFRRVMSVFGGGGQTIETWRENMDSIIQYVVYPILVAMCGYIVWLLKQQKKDRDANAKGTMLLLRAKLIEYHSEWTERQYVTRHGLQNFLEMYDAYHSLGGNGMVTHMKEEIEKLSIRD